MTNQLKAIRRKKTASMVLAAQAVKNGEADAIFSAGNTGALSLLANRRVCLLLDSSKHRTP